MKQISKTRQPLPSISIATPAQIRTGGKGMEIRWGITDSPFGKCFLAETSLRISHLSFLDNDETESLETLTKDWPDADLQRDDELASSTSQRIFTEDRPPISLHIRGTEFQLKVWRALLEIADGELSTYGRLAKRIGMDGAARAVGNAVGRNRISYIIPCHRVIRENGVLGGYRWGTTRKKAMLAHEKAKLIIRP